MTEIVLNLPAPPPINKTRRVDWGHHKKHMQWRETAWRYMLEAGAHRLPKMRGPFEIELTVNATSRRDLDSPIKSTIDFLVALRIVANDSPEFLRKITVQFGDAPDGIRVVLRDWEGK